MMARPNCLRFRLGPDMEIALGTMVRSAGEEMAGERVELVASRQPGGVDAPEVAAGGPGILRWRNRNVNQPPTA